MAQATVRARKAAVNKVLPIYDDNDAQDVTSIDLDGVIESLRALARQRVHTPEPRRIQDQGKGRVG